MVEMPWVDYVDEVDRLVQALYEVNAIVEIDSIEMDIARQMVTWIRQRHRDRTDDQHDRARGPLQRRPTSAALKREPCPSWSAASRPGTAPKPDRADTPNLSSA